MRVTMGLLKNEHGVYYVRKKVPKRLQEAAAVVTGASKSRQTWLKQSLKTKDVREAKRLAPPVLIRFDRILAEAEASLTESPLRTSLDDREIERIADYFYAWELAADEERRQEGDSEQLFQDVARQLNEAGIEYNSSYAIGAIPAFGLSDREMDKIDQSTELVLPRARQALARGDISMLRWEVDELLKVFRINLDPKSASYRKLGIAVLKQFVRALEATARRQKGDPVDTPALLEVQLATPSDGGLRAAFAGWKKVKERPANTLREFEHAVEWFMQLHGDLPVAKITRRHAREFREALQEVPVRRSGKLRQAALPEIVEWSKQHPGVKKIAPATVNKLLGGIQALVVWSRNNGLIPDDVPWADPFSDMRLEEAPSEREPWQPEELQMLFGSPVYTEGARPTGGRGEASFWLPLLGLYTGARLNELAPLGANDVTTDKATGIAMITIKEDLEEGRRLKTVGSRRSVPVHPELLRIGFTDFVDHVRKRNGANGRLFPLLIPGPKGGFGEAWSKWFGRYKRGLGITNKASVFHSFRHSFKDALRAAGVAKDLNDALCGQAGQGGVARKYGAKDMVRRFTLPRLAEAVANVTYPGVDLSQLRWQPSKSARR
jgi:integrase